MHVWDVRGASARFGVLLWEAVGWVEGVRGKQQNLYSGFDPVAYLPWDFPFCDLWVFRL